LVNPNFDLKLEKKPAAEPKKDAPKKDAPKKDAQKKDAPKKETQAKKPAPVAEVKKEITWEQGLPETKFDFYDYKTLFVNAKSKKEALEKLWGPEMWEDKALSFWLIQY
jgi:hypothetical protein